MKDDNLIIIKKKNELLNFLMFGYLFVILGIISLLTGNLIGVAFLILGLLIVTLKKGIIVDTKNKQIIHYKTIALFYTKKTFTDITNVKYIALVRVKLTQNMNVGSITGLTNYSEMQVKFNFIMNDRKIIPLYIERKKNVFPIAEKISKDLGVKVYDNSEGKKVWIG